MKTDEFLNEVKNIINEDNMSELKKELDYLYKGIGWAEWDYFKEGLAYSTNFKPEEITDEDLEKMINASGIAKVKKVEEIKDYSDMEDFNPEDFNPDDKIILTKKPMSNQFYSESSQKNENYSFDKDQFIKASTILRTIATNSNILSTEDTAVLLRAAAILTDNLTKFAAGEAADTISDLASLKDIGILLNNFTINESISKYGLDYMAKRLPKTYKVKDLQRYGQINNDSELIDAVDKEVNRLEKQYSTRLANVRKFMHELANKLNTKLDEKYYGNITSKVKSGSPQYFYTLRDDIRFNYDVYQPEPEIEFNKNNKIIKATSLNGVVYTPKDLK